MQEHIACYDADNGKKLWERKYNVYLSTVPFTRVGWASLVGDPETGNVYAHGVGGLLICLDKDGKQLWLRSLTEEYGHISGYGGRTDTPIVDENLVILIRELQLGDGAVRHRYSHGTSGPANWCGCPRADALRLQRVLNTCCCRSKRGCSSAATATALFMR
jgi:hypothetical protein